MEGADGTAVVVPERGPATPGRRVGRGGSNVERRRSPLSNGPPRTMRVSGLERRQGALGRATSEVPRGTAPTPPSHLIVPWTDQMSHRAHLLYVTDHGNPCLTDREKEFPCLRPSRGTRSRSLLRNTITHIIVRSTAYTSPIRHPRPGSWLGSRSDPLQPYKRMEKWRLLQLRNRDKRRSAAPRSTPL